MVYSLPFSIYYSYAKSFIHEQITSYIFLFRSPIICSIIFFLLNTITVNSFMYMPTGKALLHIVSI